MIDDTEAGTVVVRRTVVPRPTQSWLSWLVGRPLRTAEAPHQTVNKIVGLAVFASDALSSTAYATQEMLAVLAIAGATATGLALPLAAGIVLLLAIVTISYEQTIHAYPNGGGAYIVSRDNLGDLPAQVAGSALLTDYVLTVAVSISSGVAQITSAVPSLFPWRVEIAVALVAFVMLVNLRGVRESGAVFAVPTYFFVAMMYLTVAVGLFRYLGGGLGGVVGPPPMEAAAAAALTPFLLLRAFANGTTALTGVEAISNGIPAFREPKSHSAGLTLVAMSVILGSLLLGITFLAVQIGAVPSELETVISQLARTAYGSRGTAYLLTMGSAAVILVMAANTAFADFPRLAALLAADGFLPRQLTYRGSRLVFSRGIVSLALLAAGLIALYQASVTALIPLYAVGVFLSFTLSQTGMARRWRRIGRLAPGEVVARRASTLRHDPRWRTKLVVNATGAVVTFVVMLVFAITKFRDGAWIVVLLVPALVAILSLIHRHYRTLAAALSLEHYGAPPAVGRMRVIVAVGGVHRGTLAALRYARTLSSDVTAVHVSLDPEDARRLQDRWQSWGGGVRLVILESPFRSLVEPMVAYVEDIQRHRQPNETLTIVVPQFVPRRRWHNLLHAQTAFQLRMALLDQPGIVVTNVPYQVD